MDTVWTHGQARQAETFDTVNPATSEVVATFPVHGRAEVDAAVSRAREAAAWWAGLGWTERRTQAARLEVAPDRYIGRLAELVHDETGKPLDDAQLEIILAVVHIDWAARQRPPGARPAPGAQRARGDQPASVGGVPPARRDRRDRAVELPGLHADGLDRLRAGRGQRGRVQAERAHARRPAAGWSGSFGEVGARAPGAAAGHRAGATGEALARSGVDKIAFTGSDGHRAQGDGRLRRHPHPDAGRVRRQGRAPGRRRRRPRRGGRRRRLGRDVQRRARPASGSNGSTWPSAVYHTFLEKLADRRPGAAARGRPRARTGR